MVDSNNRLRAGHRDGHIQSSQRDVPPRAAAAPETPACGAEQRRFKVVCYSCGTPFEVKAGDGSMICPSCVLDGLRGGRRFRPRF